MSEEKDNKDKTNFRVERVKKLKEMYSDDISLSRKLGEAARLGQIKLRNAVEVRKALQQSIVNKQDLVSASKNLYATNPIYASIVDYISNMFMWRYKVIPHKVYTKSKAKSRKEIKEEDFNLIYQLMIEAVDGLSIETKFPSLLSLLIINGAVYFSTTLDEDSLTVNTVLLPDRYCKKIGETQFGTAIIQFNFEYFDDLNVKDKELKELLAMFPKEFSLKYNKYKKNKTELKWQTLDPFFSSALLLNEFGVPSYIYTLGSILNFEQYQDNELERNENLLKYIVVHTMPHYNDQLIFEVDEVAAIHQSMKKIIETGEKARLITTYGDIHVDKIAENNATENEVLAKSFKSIFNNAGFNDALFTGDSVTALELSLIRDKGRVWGYIQSLLNFYTIAINNWFDFKNYQANIDILPISPYTYNDDIEVYRENATLGVGKIDYLIASGIKQKNIQDQLYLEKFLRLEDITPMQSSYTQTADDRKDENGEKRTEDKKKSGIEPTDKNDSSEQKDVDESEIKDKEEIKDEEKGQN